MQRNTFYYGSRPPVIGSEWTNHDGLYRYLAEHVKTLEVLQHDLRNGREAWLCRVEVLGKERKPENITKIRK